MSRPRALSTARRLAVGGAAVLLLVAAVPAVSGLAWHPVVDAVRAVPVLDLGLLGALWLAGLLLHTFTLTAAMPRLTHRRALTLSLTGSAVANVLPLGGAAGIAVNYRMVRAWGFGSRDFATYTLVTNVWDVLAKLCLPPVAIAWLLLRGDVVTGPVVTATVAATSLLTVLSLTLGIALLSRRATARLGAVADRCARVVLTTRGRPGRDPALGARLVLLREQCAAVVRAGWARLTAGMLAYTLSLAVLLWGCLQVAGAGLPLAAVFAGFALERLLTLAGLTPGGAGVVEVGLAGLLLLLGGDPLGVVAGTVLYRAFTFGLEIPVGGVGLAGWLWIHRRHGALVNESAAA